MPCPELELLRQLQGELPNHFYLSAVSITLQYAEESRERANRIAVTARHDS
jgi:hypothetical protein